MRSRSLTGGSPSISDLPCGAAPAALIRASRLAGAPGAPPGAASRRSLTLQKMDAYWRAANYLSLGVHWPSDVLSPCAAGSSFP